jgi:hypothetical protein
MGNHAVRSDTQRGANPDQSVSRFCERCLYLQHGAYLIGTVLTTRGSRAEPATHPSLAARVFDRSEAPRFRNQ